MLIEIFPNLEKNRVARGLRAFLRSDWYLVLVTLLVTLSELFSLELPCYYAMFLLGVLVVLFSEDGLGLVPLAVSAYFTFSAAKNPGKNGAGVFSKGELAQLFALAAAALLLLLFRMATVLFEKRKRGTKGVPRLFLGYLALLLAYLLAGLFSGHDFFRSALFGAVQWLSVAALYFYCYFAVDWEKTPRDYLFRFLTVAGVGLLVQTAGMYLNAGVFGADGVERAYLYTGWGIYNNVGCILAMCLPAPFYFAVKRRHGPLFSALGVLFMAGICATQSRASILFGGVIFIACIVFVLVKTKGTVRLCHLLVYALALSAVVAVSLFFKGKVAALFHSLIEAGSNPFSRLTTWKKCWERFLESPVFGAGFYNTPGTLLQNGGMHDLDSAPAGVFLPPRAHNTFFQLIASGGIFALVCYLYHRAETLHAFFARPTVEKTVIFFSVAALLLTSLLDCHFFNFGPGLVYAVLLAFAEGSDMPLGKPLPWFFTTRKKRS